MLRKLSTERINHVLVAIKWVAVCKHGVVFIPQVKVNNSVTPQFTEGPVNADFSGVLQVNSHEMFPFNVTIYIRSPSAEDFLSDTFFLIAFTYKNQNISKVTQWPDYHKYKAYLILQTHLCAQPQQGVKMLQHLCSDYTLGPVMGASPVVL